MIITKIQGGLGNQLFQYAAAYALAKSQKTSLYLDIEFYTSKPNYYQKKFPRKFELDNFNISAKKLSKRQSSLLKYLFKFQNTLNLNIYLLKKIIDPDIFSPNIFPPNKRIYLEGYWQNKKYFCDFNEFLLHEFKFKTLPNDQNKNIIDYITKENSVAIHIRRGDYVNINQTLNLQYYLDATNYMKKNVNNPKFIYFSDNTNWVKKNIKLNASDIIVDFNKPDEGFNDLRLMSLCKHNIIANSTLSWWGAWFNQNTDKIVIVPKSHNNITNDFYPNEWIKF